MENCRLCTWGWLHSDSGSWKFHINIFGTALRNSLHFGCSFQVDFLDVSKFPSYSRTGYRSLEKGFHCEDSLLHVFATAPLPPLLPLPHTPPLLLSSSSQERQSPKSSSCVSLYPPSYCHHLSMWLGPMSTTLSIGQVFRTWPLHKTQNVGKPRIALWCFVFLLDRSYIRHMNVCLESLSLPENLTGDQGGEWIILTYFNASSGILAMAGQAWLLRWQITKILAEEVFSYLIHKQNSKCNFYIEILNFDSFTRWHTHPRRMHWVRL